MKALLSIPGSKEDGISILPYSVSSPYFVCTVRSIDWVKLVVAKALKQIIMEAVEDNY